MATPIAIAVVEHRGAYLVGRRPEGIPLAGLWEFPGGKLRAEETPAQAAVRECLEETGVDVEVVAALLRVLHAYAHGELELHFLLCRPRRTSPQPRAPFEWVEQRRLAELAFPEANRPLIRRLLGESQRE
jgi:8-oxo-dGTP diphosphatase